MSRLIALVAVVGASFAPAACRWGPSIERVGPPNIVLILADDLGYGELGCYGQAKIRTPHLDALAAEGMRFTQFYSGSCVCAPTRCTLMTGQHTAHSYVRDNLEVGGWERGDKEGQLPLPEDTFTLARMLQRQGYATACIGKWGLGGPGSSGEPLRQGFDHFYGYLCQRQAHNYYPEHLWRDLEKEVLDGNVWQNRTGPHFACDRMIDAALAFVEDNAHRPFFLYFATPVPHVALQVPDDSIAEYRGRWDDPAYDGKKGYIPHPTPRAAYAAMITRMDRDIGRLLALLDGLGLRDDTLVVFTSDNGPTYAGGADAEFFDSAGGLRGLKGSLFEGGIRVPMIARWPGVVPAGSVSDHPCAMWDLLPTLGGVATASVPPAALDGVDFGAALRGEPAAAPASSFYWEYHGLGGWQATRLGDWKAVRRDINKVDDAPIELYDLARDRVERHDVAADHPDVVERAATVFASRTASHIERWNF